MATKKDLKTYFSYIRDDVGNNFKENEQINNKKVKYELCPSFNSKFKEIIEERSTDIKIVIVGSFTPCKGRKNGYFYASQINDKGEVTNGQLKILQKCILFNKGNKRDFDVIIKCYKDLKNHDNKDSIIEEINKLLIKHNLIFQDIIDYASSPYEEGYANDEYIKPYCLDKRTFERLYDDTKCIFICNSRFAEAALKKVLPQEARERISYCGQYNRHKSIEERVEYFNNLIREKVSH